MLVGTQITELIRDIVRQGAIRPVSYFLQKYRISYEEYIPYSYAAIAACEYTSIARKYKERLGRLSRTARDNAEQGRKLTQGNPEAYAAFGQILQAIKDANEPFAEDYINEEVKKL